MRSSSFHSETWHPHLQWDALQQNKSELRKPKSFIMGSKHASLCYRGILHFIGKDTQCKISFKIRNFTSLSGLLRQQNNTQFHSQILVMPQLSHTEGSQLHLSGNDLNKDKCSLLLNSQKNHIKVYTPEFMDYSNRTVQWSLIQRLFTISLHIPKKLNMLITTWQFLKKREGHSWHQVTVT